MQASTPKITHHTKHYHSTLTLFECIQALNIILFLNSSAVTHSKQSFKIHYQWSFFFFLLWFFFMFRFFFFLSKHNRFETLLSIASFNVPLLPLCCCYSSFLFFLLFWKEKSLFVLCSYLSHSLHHQGLPLGSRGRAITHTDSTSLAIYWPAGLNKHSWPTSNGPPDQRAFLLKVTGNGG